MPVLEMTTGEMLRAVRLRRGFTLRKLEELSGVSHTMIAYYENDRTSPPLDKAHRLCKALGIGIETLVGDSSAAGLADDIPLP